MQHDTENIAEGTYLQKGQPRQRLCNDDESTPLLKEKQIRSVSLNDGSNSYEVAITRLVTVEPVIVLYFVVNVAFMPLLQQYLHARLSIEYGYGHPNSTSLMTSETICVINNITNTLYKQIQTEASFWMVVILGTMVIPSMVLTIFLGAYSDKAGRKIAIIPPLLGGIIRTILVMITMAFNLPVWVLPISTALEGLSGGPGALLTGCYAYSADLSDRDHRLIRILIVDISMQLGTTIGVVSVGFLINSLGFVYPTAIFLGILLLLFVYAIFLPEPIIKDNKARFFDCTHFCKTISLYTRDIATKRRWKLIMIALILTLATTFEAGSGEIITFYFLNPPFCWTSILIGIYSGYSFLLKGLFSIGFIKLLRNRMPELGFALTGLFSTTSYYVVLAVVRTTNQVFFGMSLLFCIQTSPG